MPKTSKCDAEVNIVNFGGDRMKPELDHLERFH